MRSPALAIAWEIWGASRRGFLLIAAAIPAFAVLYQVPAKALREFELLRGLSLLPMIFSLVLVFEFFHFTELDPKGVFSGGFPPRLFRLPVRTRLLVSCPMLYGVLTVATIYAGWVLLVYLPLGIQLPLAWPGLFLTTGMVFYQSIIWALAGFRLTRLIAISVAGTGLLGLAIIGSVRDIENSLHWPVRTAVTVTVLALTMIAYLGALLSVELQRHGGLRGWAWWRWPSRLLLVALPRRRRPFASPAGAQFWFEWRRNGVVLPCCVGFIVVVVAGPVLRSWGTTPGVTYFTSCWLLLSPILLAGFVGLGFGKPDFWSPDLALQPFLATRPLSSGALVRSKLNVALLSTVLSWALVLVVTPLWLILWCDTSLLAKQWQQFQQQFPPLALWAILALSLLAAMALTWRLLVGHLWLSLCGQSRLWFTCLGLQLVCWIALTVLVGWFLNRLDRGEAARAMLPYLKRLFEWVPWLTWAVQGAFVLKMWSAVWTWHDAMRRGLVSSRVVATYVCIWLAVTGCLIVLPYAVFSSARISAPASELGLVLQVEWLKHLFALAMLLLLPLARVGFAPRALAWNRHR